MSTLITAIALPLLILAALSLIASYLSPEQRRLRRRRGSVEVLREMPIRANRRRGAV